MGLELEVKLKVDELDSIRNRLVKLGAAFVRDVTEFNRLYDDAAGSLRSQDRGLRIRSCHDGSGQYISSTLTYKGPQYPGPFKQREEFEVSVGHPRPAAKVLAALGYSEVLSFQKHRESWKLASCEIDLDLLPSLGSFVEIEGPDQARIERVLDLLGLASLPIVRSSYVALVADYCAATGRHPPCLVFES